MRWPVYSKSTKKIHDDLRWNDDGVRFIEHIADLKCVCTIRYLPHNLSRIQSDSVNAASITGVYRLHDMKIRR
jgi:hypothetical protein